MLSRIALLVLTQDLLAECRELLEYYGLKIDEANFTIELPKGINYLQRDERGAWWLGPLGSDPRKDVVVNK